MRQHDPIGAHVNLHFVPETRGAGKTIDPVEGPNNWPLRDSFNATRRQPTRPPPPASPPATVVIESAPPASQDKIPETQIPICSQEVNVDMNNNHLNLEINRELPWHEEAPDCETIITQRQMHNMNRHQTSTTNSNRYRKPGRRPHHSQNGLHNRACKPTTVTWDT